MYNTAAANVSHTQTMKDLKRNPIYIYKWLSFFPLNMHLDMSSPIELVPIVNVSRNRMEG